MKFIPSILLILLILSLQCSKNPTSPKLATIAVYVYSGPSVPVSGIRVDLLQMSETKTTDTAGIASFQVNAGSYTVRVHDIQRGGLVVLSIDSTISVGAAETDTLKYFDCLMCY